MTALLDLWAVPTFKRALLGLLQYPRDVLQSLSQAEDLAQIPAPDSQPELPDWEAATAALRTIYGFARTDSVDAVVNDVMRLVEKEPDSSLYAEGLAMLLRLLAPRDVFDRIQTYRQVRETALPQLIAGRISIDLRVVNLPAGIELVPIISARLELDEDVGGTDTIRCSIPPAILIELRRELARIERTYESLKEGFDGSSSRPEAWFDWSSGGAKEP